MFFASAAEWREWLAEHHIERQELLVGFFKRDTGRPSMTWSESVDVALCFGWIDAVRRRIDDQSYSIRFTHRKPRSVWSALNVRRVHELSSQGLMHPSGLEAFESRSEERTAIYSFEQEHVALEKAQETEFRERRLAWKFFQSQANWYRKAAIWWVVSAKREETRARRLASLIDHSEREQTLPHLTRQSAQN